MKELTGEPINWTYVNDFWALGPPLADDKANIIPSTKKLRTVLTKRARIYRRELDSEGLADVREQHINDERKYAYVEAKSNGIMGLACFPIAVCPAELRAEASKFLSTAGWKGHLLVLDVPAPTEGYVGRSHERDPQWDYAWVVRDALMEYAAEHGLFLRVET
jgi:hypothetical protein